MRMFGLQPHSGPLQYIPSIILISHQPWSAHIVTMSGQSGTITTPHCQNVFYNSKSKASGLPIIIYLWFVCPYLQLGRHYKLLNSVVMCWLSKKNAYWAGAPAIIYLYLEWLAFYCWCFADVYLGTPVLQCQAPTWLSESEYAKSNHTPARIYPRFDVHPEQRLLK